MTLQTSGGCFEVGKPSLGHSNPVEPWQAYPTIETPKQEDEDGDDKTMDTALLISTPHLKVH